MTAKDYSELHEAAALFLALGETRRPTARISGQHQTSETDIVPINKVISLVEIGSELKTLGRRKEIQQQSLEQQFIRQLTALAEEHGIITLLLVDDNGFPVVEINPVLPPKALAALAMTFGLSLDRIDTILGRETGELLSFSLDDEQKLSLTSVILMDRTLFLIVISMEEIDISDGIVSLKEHIISFLT